MLTFSTTETGFYSIPKSPIAPVYFGRRFFLEQLGPSIAADYKPLAIYRGQIDEPRESIAVSTIFG